MIERSSSPILGSRPKYTASHRQPRGKVVPAENSADEPKTVALEYFMRLNTGGNVLELFDRGRSRPVSRSRAVLLSRAVDRHIAVSTHAYRTRAALGLELILTPGPPLEQ